MVNINKILINRILLYSLSALLPYFLIKKFFPEKKLKSRKDLRGGDNTNVLIPHLINLFTKDRAVRISLTSFFITVIVNEFNESIVGGMIQSTPSILAAPNDKKKFLGLSKKIRNILGTPDIIELRELLLDKNLSPDDKLQLFKIKVLAILKTLHGKKRVYFIITIISFLIFIFGNNTPIFGLFWSSLRELFKANDFDQDIDVHLIEIYREFNAPLPEELITKVLD
jgi:hypothetical protein